jgi:hypothetical protein
MEMAKDINSVKNKEEETEKVWLNPQEVFH